MGCDGGTIPRRDELVKLKKKPEQKDKDSELVYKWRHCSLTQERLVQPIICCGLGKLYNKQAIIEGLLSKSLPESVNYIKSLKDIKDLKLTPNPAYKKTNDVDDNKVSPYICPIIGLEMTGRFRFICLWTCGCVFSERALKELKGNQCITCQESFTNNDVVVLNGTDEDHEVLKERINIRKQLLKDAKQAKKDKKKAKSSVTSEDQSTSIANEEEENGDDSIGTIQTKNDIKDLKNLIKAQKNLIKEVKSARKAEKRAARDGPSTSKAGEPIDLKPIHDPMFKKAKGEYSVAKDPNATEVFKSLFTSHSNEKQQDRAHWVTYNPFYN